MKTLLNQATLAWLAISCVLLAGCGDPNNRCVGCGCSGGRVHPMPLYGQSIASWAQPQGFASASDAPSLEVPLPHDVSAQGSATAQPSIEIRVALDSPGRFYRRVTIEIRGLDGIAPDTRLRLDWNAKTTQAYQLASFEELLPPLNPRSLRLELDVFRVPAAPATDDASRELGTVSFLTGGSTKADGSAAVVYDDRNDQNDYEGVEICD